MTFSILTAEGKYFFFLTCFISLEVQKFLMPHLNTQFKEETQQQTIERVGFKLYITYCFLKVLKGRGGIKAVSF